VELMGCKFQQVYGMTEASGMVSLLPNEQLLLGSERQSSAGRSVGCNEVVIRRPDGTPCNVREQGEITVRSPNVMKAYWNKSVETKDALRDGWYWSGDLGYVDEESFIYVVDRAKDMIVSGGENVYSIEVEAALASHSAVREVAVIAIPDEKWGEAVHAVVYIQPGISVSKEELVDHCRKTIAGYKCPKSVSFSEKELPKSAVGKILKRELRKPYWENSERSVS